MWNRRNLPRGRKSRASPILRGPSPSGSKGPQGPHSGVRVITVTHSASTAPVASLPSLGGERLVMQSLSCGLCSVTPVQWMNTSFHGVPCSYRWSAVAEGTGWASDRAGWSWAPPPTKRVTSGISHSPPRFPRAPNGCPTSLLRRSQDWVGGCRRRTLCSCLSL